MRPKTEWRHPGAPQGPVAKSLLEAMDAGLMELPGTHGRIHRGMTIGAPGTHGRLHRGMTIGAPGTHGRIHRVRPVPQRGGSPKRNPSLRWLLAQE